MSLDAVLSGAALVAAVGAIGVYGFVLVRRFQMIRLLTGLGLFLTGMALFQAPRILSLSEDPALRFALLLLIVAVVAQAASCLRTRPEWNGVNRRAGQAEA